MRWPATIAGIVAERELGRVPADAHLAADDAAQVRRRGLGSAVAAVAPATRRSGSPRPRPSVE